MKKQKLIKYTLSDIIILLPNLPKKKYNKKLKTFIKTLEIDYILEVAKKHKMYLSNNLPHDYIIKRFINEVFAKIATM